MLSGTHFDGNDFIEVPHNQSFVLANGSVAVTFTPEDVAGRATLFSKDAKGFGAGGHLAAFVRDGRIEVQLQNTKDTVTLKTEPGSIRVGEDYSLVVTFGADGFRVYLDGELAAWRPDVVTGLDKNTQNLVLGANTWLRDQRNPSWTGDYFVGTMEDFDIYGRALSRAEVALIGAPQDPPGPTQGTSNSGLDRLVDIIYADPGLYRNVPAQDVADGAANADAMNRLIVEAIKATGVANDHMLNAADLRDVNAYLRANHAAKWITLHGDDEDSAETGFHLVQNDGATTYLFGDENAVNTVADGIYHLGFEIRCERLLNEDGNENATLKDVAFWLNKLLAKDLAGDTLVNTKVDLVAEKTTGTGLDQLVETIVVDPGLNRNLPTSEIIRGAEFADAMNVIIVRAIRETGVANDGGISPADVRDINAHIRKNSTDRWVVLHGDDEDGSETGFHLVQNDGATTQLFGDENAVNTVADGLYHLGFQISNGRLLNEDGNENASLRDVAFWLNELLAADLAAGKLANPKVNLSVKGTTNTGLDQLVEIIAVDPGLDRNIPTSEIVMGAKNADAMSRIIIEAIKATGVANDGAFSAVDVRDVNAYIRTNYAASWITLHGDDEDGSETGFHLVQNDGATTQLFGDENAVNTVADGIYHLGFAIQGGRLLNEDGHANASLKDVAFWLNKLLAADLAKKSLVNAQLQPDAAKIAAAAVLSQGTVSVQKPGDQLEVPHSSSLALANGTLAVTFTADEVTGRKTLFSKDAKGQGAGGHIAAFVRDGRIEVQLQDTKNTWVLKSDAGSIRPGKSYPVAVTFGSGGFRLFLDGELISSRDDVTTGLNANTQNLVIGANSWLRDKNNPKWIGDVFDGTIGKFTIYNRALSRLEMASIASANGSAEPTRGKTGTGLDKVIDILYADPGLYRNVPASEIDAAAASANAMNALIVEAIMATGVANDRTITTADVRDINAYILAKHATQWVVLHGDDESTEETGFHLVQHDGGTTQLFGDDKAVDTVADGIYHLGFAVCGDQLLNEDGNANAHLADVAFWLSEFLAKDLAAGTLANTNVDLIAERTTLTGLDQLVDMIVVDRGLNRNLRTSEIIRGAEFANAMNVIIVEAIRATGVANDRTISESDVRDINTFIRARYEKKWMELHGDDEDGAETGFHLVQNDGAKTRLFGDDNAVDTVADGIYHLGFQICGHQLLNEDGNANANLTDVAFWLNELLAKDLAAGTLANKSVDLAAEATSKTGLDRLIEIIATDRGLNRNVATSEIVKGADSGNAMNLIIVEAIKATGVANDGALDALDIRDINAYIQSRYATQWMELHGDDEDDQETGFHLVQNDGARSQLFGDENAVDTVADGLYHLGFKISGNRLLNEDGNANASLRDAAFWLSELLVTELAKGALENTALKPNAGDIARNIVFALDKFLLQGKT